MADTHSDVTNIVQRVDVTTIANEDFNDHDYDDPYPMSGLSKPPLIPYT